jgi:hypothetical protein
MPDYLRQARDLRAKANYVPPPGSGLAAVGAEEKAALLAKAEELERKYAPPPPPPSPPGGYNPFYRNPNSRDTDDTTVTNRSGQRYTTYQGPTYGRAPYIDPNLAGYWYDILNDLLIRQPAWNKPPDEEDIVAEEYRTNDFNYEYEEEDYEHE